MINKKQIKSMEFENFKFGYPIEKPVEYSRIRDIQNDIKIKARVS
jgi:hypothetical protein